MATEEAGSAHKHVTGLQPDQHGLQEGRIKTATEFSPLISTAPALTETRVLNPAVEQPENSGTNPKNSAVEEVAEVASINSNHSDKDWHSHVSSLLMWALPLIRLCVLLFLAGVGITVSQPSMDVIYYKLACQSLMKNSLAPPAEFRCDPVQSQQIVSTYLMWDNIVQLAVSLATCTKVSALSDIYGRKPFLTAFIVCFCVTYYIDYFLMLTSLGFPMWGLWAATAIGSCTGGLAAFMALFKAYITDITVALERVNGISFCLVSFTAGQLVGPLLSSVLLSHARRNEKIPKIPRVSDPSIASSFAVDPANLVPRSELVPLKASLFIFTLAAIFCFVLLLELRSERSRMKSRSASVILLQAPRPHLPTLSCRIWHGFTSFIEPLQLLTFPTKLRTEENAHNFKKIRLCVFLLSIAELFFSITILLTMIVEPQYTIYKYGWDSVTILNFLMSRSVAQIFGLAVFLPLLYKHIFPRFKHLHPVANTFDAADSWVMGSGVFLYSLDHLGKAFAPTGTVFVGLALAGSLATIVGPVAAAAPVKFFPSSKVGEFYGALALAQGIISLVAPMVVTSLYTHGVKHGFPGLSYIYTASILMTCCACVVTARMAVREKRSVSPSV